MNSKTRKIFETRAKIIAYVRRYLDSNGFLEVETTMLNQIAGGATAKPFKSWHNELGIPMFMRIAPELTSRCLWWEGLTVSTKSDVNSETKELTSPTTPNSPPASFTGRTRTART